VVFFAFWAKPSVLRYKDVSTSPLIPLDDCLIPLVAVPANQYITWTGIVQRLSYHRVAVAVQAVAKGIRSVVERFH
jgi:hypothetical protein